MTTRTPTRGSKTKAKRPKPPRPETQFASDDRLREDVPGVQHRSSPTYKAVLAETRKDKPCDPWKEIDLLLRKSPDKELQLPMLKRPVAETWARKWFAQRGLAPILGGSGEAATFSLVLNYFKSASERATLRAKNDRVALAVQFPYAELTAPVMRYMLGVKEAAVARYRRGLTRPRRVGKKDRQPEGRGDVWRTAIFRLLKFGKEPHARYAFVFLRAGLWAFVRDLRAHELRVQAALKDLKTPKARVPTTTDEQPDYSFWGLDQDEDEDEQPPDES
jgi:hypothetical protein